MRLPGKVCENLTCGEKLALTRTDPLCPSCRAAWRLGWSAGWKVAALVGGLAGGVVWLLNWLVTR